MLSMTHLPRRALLGTGLASLAAPALHAAEYPTRPVRIIVPNPPGGSADVLTRIMAAELSGKFGQPFVIENRAGAGGNIGLDVAAKSAPDGYTLAAATVSQWVINAFLYPTMNYDPRGDFTYISLCWEMANILLVPASVVPARNVEEFIAWGRAQPDGLVFCSPGIGTSAHLLGELFGLRNGIKVTHLPFRGMGESGPAMLRGDVHFAIDNLASWLPMVRGGQMRALAIAAEGRSPLLPNLPTMPEAGQPEFVVTVWAGFVAPKGTPQPIVDAISAALQEAGRKPEVERRFTEAGATLRGTTGPEMLARADRERPFWQELVRISGARVM
jgi:tripartite-type tricarboxylate transporter receptor subunit TctC